MRRHFSAPRICCGSIKATSPFKDGSPSSARKEKPHGLSNMNAMCAGQKKVACTVYAQSQGMSTIYLISRGNEILASVKYYLIALLKFHVRISLKNPRCEAVFPGKSALINLEVRLSSLYLNSARRFCFNTTLVNLNYEHTDYSWWVLIKQLK